MRFHGIAADWVTDFKAEVERRFNKKPFSQELTPPSWTVFYCSAGRDDGRGRVNSNERKTEIFRCFLGIVSVL